MTDLCFVCERNPVTWPGDGMCSPCFQEMCAEADAADRETPVRDVPAPRTMVPDILLRVMRGRVGALRLEAGHWRGDCPWCDEGGELCQSLYVYPVNIYHCFACGAHGDAISFIMWHEGIGFMAAVEWLAAEAGLSRGAMP